MSTNGKTVLLVEDNEDNRIVYSTILRHFGYSVSRGVERRGRNREGARGEAGPDPDGHLHPDHRRVGSDAGAEARSRTRGTSRSSRSPRTRSRRTVRRRWKSAATATSRSRASRAPSSPKCRSSSGSDDVGDLRQGAPRRLRDCARILIVDDHEDNIELLRVRLEAWGYHVEAAHGRRSRLLDQVEASPPDLILLDVMMPTVDGIEVARRIKENTTLPFIPIIMQTALDSTESQGRGARGRRRRLHHEADRLRRAQGAAALDAAHQAAAGRARGARASSCSKPTSGCGTCRRPTRSRDSTIGGHLSERLDEMFEHARTARRAVLVRHVRPGSLQERERHLRPPGRRRGAQAVRGHPQATKRARSTASDATAARSSCSSFPARCSTPR